MVLRSPASVGIHTFITDQRFAPVNIARNTKKNPMYPQKERSLYASTQNTPSMSMIEVTLTLKAKPMRMPVSIMIWRNSFWFFIRELRA